MQLKMNLLNKGVKGPRKIHWAKGWKTNSPQPYAYFSHLASSSYTVRDTPSLKPWPAYDARRRMEPDVCSRSARSKSSETVSSDQNFSIPSLALKATSCTADQRR